MNNKNKYLLIGLGVIIGISIISNLFSCESDEEQEILALESETMSEIVLTPETVKIKGHLGDCFQVVEKDYKVKDNKLTVEIERTEGTNALLSKHIDNLTGSKEAGKCRVNFIIELLDSDNTVINTHEVYDSDAVVSLIKNTRPGETGIIQFLVGYDDNLSQYSSFRLASICEINAEKEKDVMDKMLDKVLEDDGDEEKEEKDLKKDMENAEKAIDAGVKMLDAAGKAMKMLNDLE